MIFPSSFSSSFFKQWVGNDQDHSKPWLFVTPYLKNFFCLASVRETEIHVMPLFEPHSQHKFVVFSNLKKRFQRIIHLEPDSAIRCPD